VLGTCVDVACDGEISLYLVAPDSSLNPRVATTLTASHILPMDLVLSDSGSNAYLLTHFMRVDTNSGKLYQYSVDGTGALTQQGEIDTGSAAVAQALNGSHLYVLTSDALAAPPNGNGGRLTRFDLGSGGVPSQINGVAISGLTPTAMTLVTAP